MFLKAAIEGGLGFIANLRPHLCDADARNRDGPPTAGSRVRDANYEFRQSAVNKPN
jgi:hypothetical protein